MMKPYDYKQQYLRFVIYAFILLVVCHIPIKAQTTEDDLNSLVRDFNARINAEKNDFEQYADSVKKAYNDYIEKATAEFNIYKNNIQEVWGGDSIVLDSKYEWVEYSDDFLSRSIVNFEKGNAIVEVAVDPDASQEDIDSKLTEAIYNLMVSRGSTCPYRSQVDQSKPITQNPVLDGLLDLSDYHIDLTSENMMSHKSSTSKKKKTPPQPVVRGGELKIPQKTESQKRSQKDKTLARIKLDEKEKSKKEAALSQSEEMQNINNKSKENIAYQIAKQINKSVTKVTGKDGSNRKVVYINLPLVSDNISKSAALYKDIVKKYSNKFQIEQPLIFAVIEQESSFNPQATSHIPAYGLMQLVPTSGGVHAYSFVYGVEKVPTKSYLFDPERNIELGTAYLRVLYNMFDEVKDAHCRRLCVIASYNTGAGNVSRAFIGTTRISNAYNEINKLDYTKLYHHLTNNLSTAEARNYVKGVTKKREKYIK